MEALSAAGISGTRDPGKLNNSSLGALRELRDVGKTLVLIGAEADGRKIRRIRLARIANASATSLE
jgi:hypothetical protein